MEVKHKKIKNVSELTEGDIVGESIISESRQVLVHVGVPVTTALINKLKDWGISEIAVAVDEPVDEEVSSTQKAAVHNFNSDYQAAVTLVEHIFTAIKTNGRLPMQELREATKQVMMLGMTNVGILERLALLPRAASFVYGHSVSVGILSVVTGRWMGCTNEQLRALAMGSVLHDIGRCFLPPELFSKYYRMDAEERAAVETHCTRGYRLIENTKYIDQAVKYIVLQHHERMNGSGYPCKLVEKQIHALAKVVGFADCYDLLTYGRGLTKRLAPYQVIEKLNAERFGKLCPVTCDTFMRRCNDLLLGGTVKLSDGTMGRVVYINPQNPTRPVLQIGPDFFIDLSEETGLHIDTIMNEFMDVIKPIGEYNRIDADDTE